MILFKHFHRHASGVLSALAGVLLQSKAPESSTATAIVRLARSVFTVMFGASLLAWGGPVRSAPCVAAAMSTLVGTSCDIGALTFSFNTIYSERRIDGVGRPISSNDVWVVPDVTNNGFTWIGPFSLGSTPGSFDNILNFQLLLGLETLDPNVAVIGFSASIGTASSSPSLNNVGYAFVQAENSNWPCPGSCGIATATLGYAYNQLIANSADVVMSSIPFWDYDFGLVQFFAETQNGGSVAFDSISFGFSVEAGYERPSVLPPVATVPEPGTLVLLAFGLYALSYCRRRQLSRFAVKAGGWTNFSSASVSQRH